MHTLIVCILINVMHVTMCIQTFGVVVLFVGQNINLEKQFKFSLKNVTELKKGIKCLLLIFI